MQTIELNKIGLHEISAEEQNEIEGGWVPLLIGVGLLLFCRSAY